MAGLDLHVKIFFTNAPPLDCRLTADEYRQLVQDLEQSVTTGDLIKTYELRLDDLVRYRITVQFSAVAYIRGPRVHAP